MSDTVNVYDLALEQIVLHLLVYIKSKTPSEGRVKRSAIFLSYCSPRDVCKTKRPDEEQKVSSFYFTSHSCQCGLNCFEMIMLWLIFLLYRYCGHVHCLYVLS